jgi:hypothetical protein
VAKKWEFGRNLMKMEMKFTTSSLRNETEPPAEMAPPAQPLDAGHARAMEE